MVAWLRDKPVIVSGIILKCGTKVQLIGSHWFLEKFCKAIVPGALIFYASDSLAIVKSEYHEFSILKAFFTTKKLELQNKHTFIKEWMYQHEKAYTSFSHEYSTADEGGIYSINALP